MGTRIQQAVGVGAPFIQVFPPPIQAQRAPVSTDDSYPQGQVWFDNSQATAVEYVYNGSTWDTGGNVQATTTVAGITRYATYAEVSGGTGSNNATLAADVYTYVNSVAIAGAPDATTATKGIGFLATDAQAVAGIVSTNTFVIPSNLPAVFAAPPAIGNTTAAAGTFTSLTADGTGTVSLGAANTSNVTVTGAGADLNLLSVGGSVLVDSTENAALAIRLHANGGTSETIQIHSDQGTGVASIGLLSDVGGITLRATGLTGDDAINIEAAAGGIDIDSAGEIDIVTTEANADSINMTSAGGIDLTATGAAAKDIDIVCTSGSINLTAGENVGDSIVITSSVGGIQILAASASATEDIVITATGSSVRLTSTENVTDAINIEATLGGVNILASGASAGEDINITATGSSVNLSSTENAALAIALNTNGGTSETIRARNQQGTGAGSIELLSTAGGITFTAGLGTADAINLVTSAAGGGIDIDSGTAGFIVDTTGAISLDAAAASNFTATGAFDITVNSTAGSIIITGAEAAVDAIDINASDAAGGIDIDAGTGGITLDTTGAMSLDSAATSNYTVTGAGADLNLLSTGGSVLVEATEDVALAIRLHANGGTSETIQIHADQGTGVASIGLLSDVGGITLRSTGLASADAINLEAAAGGIDMDSALLMSLTSTRDNAQAILIEATLGGIDISASGAAAGEDIDITATGSSVNITATEAVATAIVLNASNAAGGIDISTGGGSVDISSAGLVTMVAGTSSSATASNTINTNVFAATYTGFTTAAAGTQTFTIVNSLISTTSQVFITVSNLGANDAQMTCQRVKQLAGSIEVYTINNGAAALNGNVVITGWVIG